MIERVAGQINDRSASSFVHNSISFFPRESSAVDRAGRSHACDSVRHEVRFLFHVLNASRSVTM